MSASKNDLVTLSLEPAMETRADEVTANGAPVGEPEAWNRNVDVYSPLSGHTPEPEPVRVSAEFAAEFNIADYLAEERGKDLLRFSTAGSVDDGKSTLIGRLLYDTQSVYDDQIESIEGKGTTAPGVLDLALLTDGLRAEREQGITIDVAYRYFSTARRKFIIADTPGHEQYTRNMATGASTGGCCGGAGGCAQGCVDPVAAACVHYSAAGCAARDCGREQDGSCGLFAGDVHAD